MHKVHHFDWQSETDSNFSTVLSIWDRMAMTFRMRPDPKTSVFGLEEFTDSSWQTWFAMWKTPFIAVKRKSLVLYTTAEPCPMCQAAILWTGIETVVFGTSIRSLQRLGWRQIDILAEEVVRRSPAWTCVLIGGVMEKECDALFESAIGSRRIRK